MSKEIASSRIPGRSNCRNWRSEANENDFRNNPISIPLPPPRTPLNSIQDPSQIDESDSKFRPESGRFSSVFSEKKTEALDYRFSRFFSEKKAEALDYGSPRAVRVLSHSEPNSAQSTPVRSVSRVSNHGSSVACTSGRPPQCLGGRGGSLSKVSRTVSVGAASPWPAVEVPHFELLEDSSFWMDHNVQVIIRIRPISTTERNLQGYGRCLRQESAQTLTWLGHPETRFTFDHIACETISQEKLFKVAGLPMVENCMSGYNSCMFAYGQTGSGKTYTMMGEISEIDDSLSGDCGMTPRIFEYLFTRISAEEENRRDERLKYSCKCSFLEIYNEQITDLLEPSSSNLQLREDMKKGVYVENLKEYEVNTVKDVVKLLLQGAANRKMAATYMNSESSRSHSVFTCVIESCWEKDSMTHFRFGRLNLVDLAGSERQKSSGAEGERLKEAANINKSLSTLGLVIMTLVDVAHGKHRHVPYRDSRLTFLLQDSLGGNSKTAIIANVSPSICSANETLSTLKFAQRAKLIQNNAKVNEDAAGDVLALQQQIHQLKEQLTFLLNHQNSLRFLSCQSPNFEDVNLGGDEEEEQNFFLEGSIGIRNTSNCPNVPIKKMKNLEATLVGFLRREKKAEAVVKRLEAEIEHMNHLINRREEDGQRTKMLLRFREEKIRRLELLADGILSKDEYLKEENMALSEEIHLLQAKFDRHPELTRFALENIRLQEQIKMFQDFYEQGERETLLTEVSDLRDQLLEVLKDRHAKFFSRITSQAESKLDQATSSAVQERGSLHMEVDNTSKQLEECRKNLHACIESNVKLTSEVDDLRWQLENYSSSRTALHSVEDSLSSKNDPKMEANKLSSVVPKTGTTDSENRLAYRKVVRDKLLQIQKHHKDTIIFRPSDVQKELMDAKYLVEAMESQQIHLIEELDNLRHENKGYLKLLRSKCCDDVRRVIQHETHSELSESEMKEKELDNQDADQKIESGEVLGLKANLERMHGELVEARTLNRQYQDDQASQLLHDHELEQVREEIEGETVKTILCLQGDLAALQQEIESRHASESLAVRHSLLLRTENQVLQERLHIMSQENARLTSSIAERENELNALTEEWEKATFDLTSFLVEGCQSLEDASDHIESIVSLFSHRKFWIGEKVERAVKIFIEKEQTIIYLQKRLEEAQKMGTELQLKLNSLKGATLAISEAKQLEKEEKFKEVNQLKALLCERMSIIHDLERKLENKECEIIEAEKKANETLIVAKSLYEMNDVKSPHESVANSLTIEHATEIVQWNNSNLRKDSISESFFEVKCPMNDIDEEPRKLNVVSVVEQVKKGIQDMYADENTQALGEIGAQVEMARQRVLESEIAICASYVDTEKYLSALLSDILSTSSAVRKMVHDLNNDICAMKQKFKRLKDYSMKISCVALESPSCEVSESSKIEDQYSLLCFIRGEIAKTNKKLDALKASIDTHYPVEVGDPAIVGLNMLACSGCKTRWHQPRHEECYSGHGIEEAMDSKVSSIDGYTSDIDPSPIDMGPEENKDELLSSVFCDGCSGRLDKQIWDIFPNRDSALSSRDHDMLQTQRPVNDLVCNDAIALYLKEEVESALTSLMTIHGQLSKLLANNSMAMCADSREIDYCKSFGGRSDNCQLNCGHKEESNQLAMLEMGQMLQRTDQGKEKAEASCCKTREMLCLKLSDAWFAAEDKMKQANNLLLKFEEAQETMREADLMLNELLRVNESTKFKMNWWKQVGEVLMTEKASLMEEVQQLRASIQMKDEQYESLEDQMLENVAEITALFSSLEVAFLRMQCNVEEEFKRIYSEIFSLRQELMDCIGNSRLCLESIWSQIMEKGFALFVLYQCHIGAVLEKFAYFNADSNFSQYRLSKSSSVHCNVGNICVDANGNNMGSKPMNGTEKVTQIKHSTCGVSVTGDSWDVLHEFKTVQHNHVGSHVDADFVNFDSQDLLSDKNCCAETVARSEETKLAPANGKKLIKEAITEQLNYLEKFCQELISLHGVSDGEKSADNHFGNMNLEDGATVTSIAPYTCCSCVSKELQLQNPMIVSAIAENEVTEAKLGGVTVDRNTLFTGIQNLKTICTQMISLLDEEEDHPELPLQHKQGVRGSSDDGNLQCVQGRGIGLLDFPKMRTDCGHHAVEEMVKLVNKLFFVTGYIHSTMHVGTKNRYSASLLETLFQCICCMEEKAYCFLASMPESNFKENDVFLENLSLKRQLTRKEYILEGLLFDFRLLQESASNSKDIKDKSEKMMASLSKAQHELAIKTTQLDDILIRNKELEARLADRETALCSLKYELEQGREALNVLCNDNTEFRLLLEDLCIKKTDVEEQLEEKVRVVKDLEKEVLRLATSGGDRFLSSIQEVEDRFSRVTNERDQLQAEVTSLTDKLEMANALADENEAIAVEARQVSEASKIYAEQKEEEVKILECSVEELEYTINVLEKKVYEMGEEVERHRLMREDLELELQALGERVSTVENVPENLDGVPNIEQIMKDQMSRKIDDRLLELLEAKRYMKVLEKEKAAQAEEIKQCREYISELVLHAEAQASQYQQKYKTLETMVLEAKVDTSISNPATSTLNRTDISSIRPRRSGSPFKCIASLVQQMNSEKDQELSAARRRMEELEALASTKQKEVCMLSARLLATENMTHDVIRDLLGVKLDMTNFANLIDQQQLQKFAEKAERQKEESRAKEQEILMLRKQNNDFIEERESWIEENNQRQADILAAQVRVEQFQLRDQLLTAQNEMLKMDKTNLKKKIAELDEMVKGLFGSEDIQCVQQLTKIKENDVLRVGNEKLTKRLSHTETLNSHASYEHGWYHKTDGKAPYDDIDEACRL